MSTLDKALALIARRGGTVRTSEALAAGIHARTLYALRDSGQLEQLARGLFRLAELPPPGEVGSGWALRNALNDKPIRPPYREIVISNLEKAAEAVQPYVNAASGAAYDAEKQKNNGFIGG